jgi:hypothetical protein
MKKIIIITLVLVLLLVGSIWGYLMVFGAPSSAGDVFADLGIGDSETREFEVSEETNKMPVTDEIIPPDSKNLKLLRTTAGSVVLGSTTANQVVRMVEQGTGHVYDINPKTNQEVRVSGTTYAGITNAYLSPDGSYAVMLANKNIGRTVQLVSLGSSTEAKLIPNDASEFGFSDDSKRLFYVRSDRNGSIGYSYDLSTGQDSVLFSVPFLAISASWGDRVVIYNRPGENYPGYIYSIEPDGTLKTLSTGSVNLTSFTSGDTTLVNKTTNGLYHTSIVTEGSAGVSFESLAALPEKCAASSATIIWCGYPSGPSTSGIPMEWYKGTITTSADGSALVFTDKNSNTLWYFDTTVQ